MDTRPSVTIGHEDTQYSLRDLQVLHEQGSLFGGPDGWYQVAEITAPDAVWQARLVCVRPSRGRTDGHTAKPSTAA